MKGRKTLRRAGIVLGFGLLLCAGVMASGAFGMHLDAGSGTTDSTSTTTDTAPPPSDSGSTSTDPAPSSSTSADTSTSTDSTTTSASTTTTPVTYSPKIASDKADYSPGSTVTLTGTGWAPLDSVHIFVNDDEGKTWSYNADVIADAAGNFSLQFQLPTTFVATYSVTASGTLSGTATTTFTDGNVTLHLLASEGVADMTVTFDRWNGNTTCTGAPTLTNQTVTASSGGTVNIPGFGGTGDSVKLKSVSTTTAGKTFSSWTTGDKNTDSGTLMTGSPTPCISNSTGGSNGNVTDGYAHFVNSTATLIVIKHVVNNNGGTSTASNFTMSVTGGSPSPASFGGTESPGTSVTIAANTGYSVGETGPSGYTRSDSAGCTSATGIAPGGTATCTVTNDDRAATLTVIKHVINDNGGTATAANFTMSVTGGSPSPASFAGAESPGTTVSINANAGYSVGESGPSGYTRSDSAGCTSASGLAPGGSATCTITNDDRAATLTVIKHVINNNGGTATASSFTMSVTGGSPSPASFAGAESPGTTVSINANAGYSVGESGPGGYTRSDSAGCTSASGLAPGGSATCTVTNDDRAATLTVIKHVINDNGGTATAANFTMSVTGGSPSPASFAGAESPGTTVSINANAGYSVGESGPSGYSRSDSAGCTSASGLAPGGSATCTVTNDDRAATLTVIKHVINNNGGTATASSFTMSVTGGSPSPASFSGAESPGTAVAINANTAYSVSESGPSGYTRSDSAACASVSGLAPGGSATCTVTNDDQPATLTVIKHVINDNGGSASASAFTMSVTGGSPSPATFSGAESPGTTVTLNAGTYSVGETGPSGYDSSFSNDCSGSVANGATKTCTVTNDDKAAHLIVIKHVVNDNGGTASASAFTMTIGGVTASGGNSFSGAESPGEDKTLTSVGSYGVTETGPNGYHGTASTECSGTIALGQTKTCTLTNDDIQPVLHVIKHLVNDNGGTATASAFTMSVTGSSPSPASFAGAESPGTTVGLDAGSYSVGETGPSGYASDFSADCSGTLSAGQEKTCTVTNDDVQPKLFVIKHVMNDNGGTKAAGDFSLTVTGSSPSPATFSGAESPGTEVALNAGSYSVGEGAHAGYTNSSSADCSGSVAVGQTKTCTITNNDIQPVLHVIKTVVNDNGGTAAANDFTMSVTGSSPSPASFAGAETPGTTVAINAGAYSVSESGPNGYASSFSAGCAGSLSVGDDKTCTVTNNDIQPKLIVIKHVINDNGGTKTAGDFSLSVTGSSPSPGSFAGQESPGTEIAVNAGSYSVSEGSHTGYADSYSDDCSGSIAVGETKTCTVTNNDIQPKLFVIKHVINDNGGTKTASNFTMSVTGNAASPNSFAGAEAPGTEVALNAGAYSVSETGPAGYASSLSANCSSTIAVGETKTCTVTNDDIKPILHVIKHVINDNGGTATASDFALSTNGTAASPADGFSGAEDPGTTVHMNAGTYNVTETGPSGYADSYSADCSGSLAVGEEKTCTVTNNDIQPILHVIKHVVNDNGGTAVASDFKLSTNGTAASPADGFSGAENPGTTVHMNAGTYNVTETGPNGYAASFSANCSGSLAVGQEKTCTVTNDDIQPILHVIKHVINDNGGAATASDFTMSVSGGSPDPASFAGAEAPGTSVHLNAGSYGVTETGPSGYASNFGDDCTGTLVVGDEKTCTVTNNDIQPKLFVIKHVINDNGGTKTASNFTMSVTGNAASPNSFAGAEAPGTQVALNAGAYSVGETGPAGYASSFSADCSSTIAVGETKTCTVTNDDIKPILHVIKHVINDNGGTATASDFALSTHGTAASPADGFAGAEDPGTAVHMNAGTYNVTETGPDGYAASYSADCSGSLAVGDEKTCTVTNNDIKPILHVIKHVVNDNGGTASAPDFTMSTHGTAADPADGFSGAEDPGTTVHMNAGTYNVTETGPNGYASSFSAACSGSISVGQEKTCTVTNDDIQPKLFVIKHVVNDNGGTKVAGDFTMNVTGSNASPASFAGADTPGTEVALDAGSYSVDEGPMTGYAKSLGANCSGSISVGQTKTCTITNDDIQPILHVIKHVVNDNGGTATAANFTMTVTGISPSPASSPGAEVPGTTVHLNAGSYSVSESGPSGYADTYSADCSGSVAVGDEKTCTVTNNDIQPKLVVIKHVVNDNGGTKTAGDFTMNVTGPSAAPSSFAGAESPGTEVALNAGSYSVDETAMAGYAKSLGTDCSGSISVGQTKTCTITNNDIQPKLIVIKHLVNDNGGTATAANFTMNVTGPSATPASFAGAESPGTTVALNAGSYSVTESGPTGYSENDSADCAGSIAIGETKTCTVTNNDVQPKLIVIKHVVNDNGGTATASQFSMSVTGSSPTPASFAGAESPGTQVALNAGSYSVGETGPTGYAQSMSADCAGSVAVGQTKTCTVTNDDIQPKLTVIKKVTNDDGGTKQSSDFTMSVTGNSPSPASFAGADTPGTTVTLNAGSYSVDEAATAGYTKSLGANCSGSIAIGETKSCTITNNDDNQPPVITTFIGSNSLVGPLVFVPSTFSGTFTDSAIADNPWAVNWSWDGTADPSSNQSVGANGTTSHTFGPQTHTYTTAGCSHSATVKITDKDGAFDTKTIGIQVGTGGFLPPVTNTPVTNKLKNGQVLPVKIQITDCNGAGVNNLQPVIRLGAGDQTSTPDDAIVTITPGSVSNADTNGIMRSSGSDGSYIYNMAVNIPLNTDYTIVIYPYGNTPPNDKLTLRHVIQATK